ncbi:MAG: hypothetical protein ACXQTD_08510 [Candidatus Syntropharchaeia archaeon]
MFIRKNISLKEEDIKKIEPLLEMHEGNFSAALREAINFTNFMIEKYGSLERAKEMKGFEREKYIEEGHGVILPFSLLRWLLNNSRGFVPDLEVVDESIDIRKSLSFEGVMGVINERYKMLGFPVTISMDYRDEKVHLKIKGLDSVFNEFSAVIESLYLLEQSFKIESCKKTSTSINIVYGRSDNKEQSYKQIINHFGYNQAIFKALSEKSEFWRHVIASYELLNYNLICIPKNIFEHLVTDSGYFGGIEFFELKSEKYFKDIPWDDFLVLFKRALMNAGIVDRVEYDEEKIMIYHCYGEEVSKRIEKWITRVLEATGKKFDMESYYGTTVYKYRSS